MIALYLRISLDPLKLGVGVDRQLVDCEPLAATRFPGQPTHIYRDNDRSAYTSAKRPAWDQMLTDIQAGTVTAVVAYNLDRLLRQPRQLEQLIDLGIPVVTAAGDLDLTTHDGQLQGRILAAVAKKSSDDTSRRVKRARQDGQEAGRWIGGRVSYPYKQENCKVQFRTAKSEATARQAIDMFLGGFSLRVIAATCAELDPAAPRTGIGWRWVFLCPALAGLNTAGVAGDWPAIITPVEHAQLRAILTDPARNTHPGSRDRSFWLTGIVRCGKCPTHPGMYPANESRTGVAVIRCQTCGMVVRRAYLDSAVREMLWLAAPLTGPLQTDEPPQPSSVQSAERLPELAAMYVRGELTRSEWDAARSQAAPATSIPSVLAQPQAQVPPDLRTAWPDLPPHRHHEIARRYLLSVHVLPAPHNGGHFDVNRIDPHWRA